MTRIGSLFTGIGGLDLVCEMVGLGEIVWQVEIDPACRQVLAEQWPGIPLYGNVSEIDWSQVEPVEILCGGFPCPDFSLAGKREGGDGERNLWPEFHRAIRGLQPKLVVIENVPGILSADAGTCDAGESGGTCPRAGPAGGSICRTCWRPLDHQSADTRWFFDCFLRSLAEAGFDAEWRCVRASDVGACHKRERCYIVAAATDAELAREPADGGVRRGVSSRWNGPEQAAVSAGPEVALAEDALTDGSAHPDADGEAGTQPDLGEEQPGQPAPLGGHAERLGAAPADASGGRRERRQAAPGGVDRPDGDPSGGRGEGTGEPEGRAQHASDPGSSGREGAGPAEPAGRSEPADRGGPAAADSDGAAGGRPGPTGQEIREHGEELRPGRRGGRSPGGAAPDAERSGLGEGTGLRPDEPGGVGGRRPGDERGEDDDEEIEEWAAFGPAIERWEFIVGRAAPAPTLVGTTLLNPEFVEWMMGFPEGWVASMGRTNALKALGNAVVPLQGAAAVCELLSC